MIPRAAVLIAVAALGGIVGGALGYALGSGDTETLTVTTTTVLTDATASGLPPAVEETRAAVLEAAEAGDYEALRALIPPTFRYTFGGAVEGGPIAYWQELERTTDERPLETLAAVLKLPYVLSQGYYVWPWAYAAESSADLSQHERAAAGATRRARHDVRSRHRLPRLARRNLARRDLDVLHRGRLAGMGRIRVVSASRRQSLSVQSTRERGVLVAYEELKARQSVVWGNGPYQRITETLTDIHDVVVERLEPRPGMLWLDLACGTGAVAERAASAGATVTGLDLSPVLIETAE